MSIDEFFEGLSTKISIFHYINDINEKSSIQNFKPVRKKRSREMRYRQPSTRKFVHG